jgi:dihydropyrimidinase
MNAARELRLRGLRLIIETTPHYLLLDEESLAGEDGALFLMTPPLRGAADRAVLKDALCAGEIEVLATDHCAYTPARKKRDSDCRRVPAGVPGIGEAAALLYTLLPGDAAAKALTLAAVFSMNPARFFGLSPRKGSLKPGADGDVVVFDPRAYGVISKSSLRTAAGYSPYEGFRIEGRPVMTILRGRVIAEDGEFTGTRGFGRFVPCGASAAFRGAT